MTSTTINTSELEFCGFRFFRTELNEAIASIPLHDARRASTSDVELLGKSLTLNSDDSALCNFSEKVCIWGGRTGARVNGKLKKNPTLALELRAWFEKARAAKSDEAAIRPGIAMNGLAVSFASKHLRMLDPSRFAVLDSVLSEKFGFAMNPKGYAVFMQKLREFKQHIDFENSIATLEYGIFILAR